MSRGAVAFVVPEGVDDPARVSGGNVYDRRVRDGLREAGWEVRMTEIAEPSAPEALAAALDAVEPGGIASGGLALVDGLVASWAPDALEAAASSGARIVVLAHMVSEAFPGAHPVIVDAERRALRAAAGVIATSAWTAAELVRRGLADPAAVAVATPGSEEGPAPHGGARDLLCLGVLAPHKGQDLLLDALARLSRDDWTCTVAGSPAVDPAFASRIEAAASRFDGRVRLAGVLDRARLDGAYERAGVLVAPSRVESYGMAIADARRRGLPVIAAAVGGIPEAVAGGGALLVPGDDAPALADALDRWMGDPALRARLRDEASRARIGAPRWDDTVARVAEVLAA